jgi:DNA-binding NarL/FixJ family response regulator
LADNLDLLLDEKFPIDARKDRVRSEISMNRAETIKRGRGSLRKQAWNTAFSHLSAADREAPLDAEDLQRLATAAHLSGREVSSLELLARAHRSFLNAGEPQRAARCAIWLCLTTMYSGEMAQANGWLARASRLLDSQGECVEQGYLQLAAGIRSVRGGNGAEGNAALVQAAAIGRRFGDMDLVTMGLHGQGRALIRSGKIARGVALLDEAMVAVMAGEVSPTIAGVVYCSVLESCRETFDLRRAQEWTTALNQWCASQPELVPYRGHCLLQRADIMQLSGAWANALEEAGQACEKLSEPPPKAALGAAFYRVAELHRVRGELTKAEDAYRQANESGYTIQPGFALLRMAQGQIDAAHAAIRRLADEVQELSSRAKVLEACVEIALATNDVSEARAAADELKRIAARHGAPLLKAISACSTGAVLLAERDPRKALAALRRGWSGWCELEAPYEAARARVLIALACREQGDHDAAELELAAARNAFQKLGAAPDAARLEKLAGKKTAKSVDPLTARELQVLRLVASGSTNRGIAGKLGISEKTVARHLSNMFVKLDLTSRAAATAYAYQHALV